MPSRKVPLRANARLDLAAHLPLRQAASASEPDSRPSSVAPRRWGLTWLSDMLTPQTNSFGVVRLMLALAVLVSHSVFLTTGKAELEPLYRWTNYTLGQHGVQMFFILSGILVAQSLFQGRDLRDYATARALRIFPALIVCVLVTALAIGVAVTNLPAAAYLKQQGVAAYIAKTIALVSGSVQLPGVFDTNPVPGVVNTSVWTLKYEVACYALLALIGAIILHASRWREYAIGALAVWLALVLVKPTGLELHGGAKSSVDVLRYFALFFGTGVVAYAARRFIPVSLLLLAPLAAVFYYAIGTRWQEPAAAVALGYLAIWLGSFRFGPFRAYTNVNDYSYATYLYHMPVAQTLLYIWPQMHVVPLILATVGIVLWLSCLSWDLIERPALDLRHRLWPKRAVQPAPANATASTGVAAAATPLAASATSAPPPPAAAAPIAAAPRSPSALSQAAVASARASERLMRELASARRTARVKTAAASQAAARAAEAFVATPASATATAAPAPVAKSGLTVDRTPRPPAEPAATATAASPAPAAAAPLPIEPGTAQVWRPMPAVKKLRIFDDERPQDQQPAAAAPGRIQVPLDLVRKVRLTKAAAVVAAAELAADTNAAPPLPPVSASRIAFALKKSAAADIAVATSDRQPLEPSRAVVMVRDDDSDTEPMARPSRPRPKWTPPLEPGRPLQS